MSLRAVVSDERQGALFSTSYVVSHSQTSVTLNRVFTADYPKPVPLAVVSPDRSRQTIDRDSRNLGRPSIHVTNKMTRHLCILRELVIVSPAVYLALFEILHLDMQSDGKNSLCQHHMVRWQCFVLKVNSRICLVRSSSELIAPRHRVRHRAHTQHSLHTHHNS